MKMATDENISGLQ